MFAGFFYMALFIGTYKLGQFNERHPGQLWAWCKWAWAQWTNQ